MPGGGGWAPTRVTARAAACVAARMAAGLSSPAASAAANAPQYASPAPVVSTTWAGSAAMITSPHRDPRAPRVTSTEAGRRPAASNSSFSCSLTTTGSARASTSAGSAAYGARLITTRAPTRAARRTASATTSGSTSSCRSSTSPGRSESTGSRSATGQPGVGPRGHHDGVLTGRVHDDDRGAGGHPAAHHDAAHLNPEDRQSPPVGAARWRRHRPPRPSRFGHRPAPRRPPGYRPCRRSRGRCHRRARSRRRPVGGRRPPARLRSANRRRELWTSRGRLLPADRAR